MGSIRAGYSGKYCLSKHEFYKVYHHCLQYNEWLEEYEKINISPQSIRADKEPGKHTAHSDPFFKRAEKRIALETKMQLIEQTALEADPYIAKYLLKAVTHERITYTYLRETMQIPCGKNYFYERRRRFYWLMARKIA